MSRVIVCLCVLANCLYDVRAHRKISSLKGFRVTDFNSNDDVHASLRTLEDAHSAAAVSNVQAPSNGRQQGPLETAFPPQAAQGGPPINPSAIHGWKCQYMLFALAFVCCCGPCLQNSLGPEAASRIGSFVSCFIFCYLILSGIYAAAWNGENVGNYCKVMCIWAFLQMVVFGCMCCCAGLFVGGALLINNILVKEMKEEYDRRIEGISGPRRAYYESQFFKEKCDVLFEQADKEGSGTLDMSQLQSVVSEYLGGDGAIQHISLLQKAFSDNGQSQVTKQEFVEMMKYINVVTLQEGKFTVDQAFEILQLPKTATKSDASKSYRNMAREYHPDKRTDVEPEVARRDMAEINDSKAKVDEYIKAHELASDR